MLLLAANPEVQNWIAEELREIRATGDSKTWDYSEMFTGLKRCRAVLLETLRLYPPIMALPKWTNEHPQQLQIGERTIEIPPQTGVMPSLLAVHTLPRYWQDPLHWQPSRWILSSTPLEPDLPTRLHREEVLTPAQNTYFPWSDGPQNCPGAKFAQVEFVAVLACILRENRMEVVQEPNESPERAKQRALDTTQDCNMELLLRMRNADSVRLHCKGV